MMVALLALFVALGGSSYAALTITGKNVKNGTLTSADLQNNTVKSVDINNGSLLAEDFKAGQIAAGPKGDVGPPGPQGTAGPRGLKGETGAAGGAGTTVMHFHGGPVAVPQGVSNVAVPVTNGGAFTQRANELVQYTVYLDLSAPSYLECAPAGPFGPGEIDVSGNLSFELGDGAIVLEFVGPAPPATDIALPVTVSGSNTCTTPGADLTINTIDVYTVGVR